MAQRPWALNSCIFLLRCAHMHYRSWLKGLLHSIIALFVHVFVVIEKRYEMLCNPNQSNVLLYCVAQYNV